MVSDKKSREKFSKDRKSKAKEVERAKDRKFKDESKEKDFIRKGHNNIAWRTNDPIMTQLVANLPFGNPAGLPEQVSIGNLGTDVRPFTVPGVLTIRTKLTAGGATALSGTYNSPVNLCMRKIYSYVRHANSGSKNYEAADLSMYMLSIGQALGLLGWLQRLYAIVNLYSPTNRYQPQYLLTSMGVDFNDIIANQPNLKYLIAWFGRALGALAFPEIPYLHACYEAYKWVIKDSDSPKEQFYLIDAFGFGKYDPTLTSAGGGVTWTTTNLWWQGGSSPSMTYASLYAYVHEIMDVLLSDEDIGIISGDILKAYRDGGLFKVEAFGDYEPLIKDDEVLQQIHNAHVFKKEDLNLTQIEQVAGGTNEAPYVVPTYVTVNTFTNGECLSHHLFIDAFSRIPDAKEVVNATILNPVCKIKAGSGSNQYQIDPNTVSFDLHMPCEITITRRVRSGTSSAIQNVLMPYDFRRYACTKTIVTAPDYVEVDQNTYDLTQFDWHPLQMNVTKASGGGIYDIRILGDLQNSRFFAYEVGVRIHENSMLALFNYNENNFVK